MYALTPQHRPYRDGRFTEPEPILSWIDPLAGIIACAPLWLNYHQHKRQHMAHHAHTNEDDDPDIYARGSFLGWVFLRLPVALISYFNPVQLYRDCGRFNCTRREYAYTFTSFTTSAKAAVACRCAPISGTSIVRMPASASPATSTAVNRGRHQP